MKMPHKLSYEKKCIFFERALCATCCVKAVDEGPVTELVSTVALKKCEGCSDVGVQGYRAIRYLKFKLHNQGEDAGYICFSGLRDINEEEITSMENNKLCLKCWIESNIPQEHSYIVDNLLLKRSMCKNCKTGKMVKSLKIFYTSNP
jgi:hypothetical protein